MAGWGRKTGRQMASVEIRDLGLRRADHADQAVWALREVSLTVADGEFLTLVGPSGAGKTTLLRLIAGLEAPTQGEIAIDGRNMSGVEPRARDVAMVFQGQALYPHLTARENLGLGLVLRKRPRAEIERRVAEAARLLGLEACLDRRPSGLSGGERQRVALGRALVRRPRVFLLDEPLSNLDAPHRLQLREAMLRLHGELRATMIHVTHDQGEALSMGDRVAVLHRGALQQVAEPLRLYQQPANRFVAEFIGNPPMNLLEGRLTTQPDGLVFQVGREDGGREGVLRLRLPQGPAQILRGLAGRTLICGVRAEEVECTPTGAHESGLGSGQVERREAVGAEVLLRVTLGDQSLLARGPGRLALQPGQRVALRIEPETIRFFDPQTGKSVAPLSS